jgi:hypothetical protein
MDDADRKTLKLRRFNRRIQALTLVEVLVVIAITVTWGMVLMYLLLRPEKVVRQVTCRSNLEQIGASYQTWANDNQDLHPMQVPVARGGALELAATGNVSAVFQLMSNHLSTPNILVCPKDDNRAAATNFASLAATNTSYFIGLDAHPKCSGSLLLSGDANLTVQGLPAKSGIINLTTGTPVGWTTNRHGLAGNIITDHGGVVSTIGFVVNEDVLFHTSLATNRIAIP